MRKILKIRIKHEKRYVYDLRRKVAAQKKELMASYRECGIILREAFILLYGCENFGYAMDKVSKKLTKKALRLSDKMSKRFISNVNRDIL